MHQGRDRCPSAWAKGQVLQRMENYKESWSKGPNSPIWAHGFGKLSGLANFFTST